MHNKLFGMTVVTFMMVIRVTTSAQSPSAVSATDVSRADFDAVMQQTPGGTDQQLRIADVGKANVGIGIVRRAPASTAGSVLTHTQVSEVYYVIQGAGTLVTGGKMADSKALPLDGETVKVLIGPSATGATISQGTRRMIGPGDVVVIPAGVPHQWATIDSPMNYIVVRIDPDKVLPAGYVHPTLVQGVGAKPEAPPQTRPQ